MTPAIIAFLTIASALPMGSSRLADDPAKNGPISDAPQVSRPQAVQESASALAAAFEETLFLLKAQIPELSTLRFNYDSRYIPANGSPTDWHISGWYAQSGRTIASYRNESAYTRRESVTPQSWRWTSWDGAHSYYVGGSEVDDNGRPQPVNALAVGDTRLSGALSYFLGGPVGLFYWQDAWYNIIDPTAHDSRPLHFAEIEGERCISVLFDRAVGKDAHDGAYQYPAIVWLTLNGSPAATRVVELITEEHAVQSFAGLTKEMMEFSRIEGLSGWCMGAEFLMHDFRPIESTGFIAPTRSTYTRHHELGRIDIIETRCADLVFARGGDQLSAQSPPVFYPLKVGLAGLGSNIVVSEENGTPYSIADFHFWRHAQSYATAFNGDPVRELRHVCDTAPNCAVDIALLLAILGGDAISTQQILTDGLAEAERDEGETSPAACFALISAFSSWEVETAPVDLSGYLSERTPAVIVREDDEGKHHYALLVPTSPESFHVVRPRDGVIQFDQAELRSFWDNAVYRLVAR